VTTAPPPLNGKSTSGENAERDMTHTGGPLKHLRGAFLIPDGTLGIVTHRTLGGRDRVKKVFPTPKPNCQAARAREKVAEQVATGCAVPSRARACDLLIKPDISAEVAPSRTRAARRKSNFGGTVDHRRAAGGKPTGLLGMPVCKQSVSRQKSRPTKNKAQSKPG